MKAVIFTHEGDKNYVQSPYANQRNNTYPSDKKYLNDFIHISTDFTDNTDSRMRNNCILKRICVIGFICVSVVKLNLFTCHELFNVLHRAHELGWENDG